VSSSLGLQQDRLCFPSLLLKCDFFEVVSEFDLGVGGQSGLKN
jgi:hypothetical protein